MTELHIGEQTIRYDREATAAIYASLKGGWAEDCLCAGCRNLMAQRAVIYPLAFRELLDRLGIDPNKEGEAVADGPLKMDCITMAVGSSSSGRWSRPVSKSRPLATHRISDISLPEVARVPRSFAAAHI